MNDTTRSYALDTFPAAAVRFARALDRNRERIAADEGLSAGELRAMFFIAEHISVTPKQISAHMHVTTAAVSFISRRLTSIDMLERADHPGDGRSVLLTLSPLGHTTMDRIHTDFDEMVRDSTSTLSPEQLDEFTHALTTVGTAIVERTSAPPGI